VQARFQMHPCNVKRIDSGKVTISRIVGPAPIIVDAALEWYRRPRLDHSWARTTSGAITDGDEIGAQMGLRDEDSPQDRVTPRVELVQYLGYGRARRTQGVTSVGIRFIELAEAHDSSSPLVSADDQRLTCGLDYTRRQSLQRDAPVGILKFDVRSVIQSRFIVGESMVISECPGKGFGYRVLDTYARFEPEVELRQPILDQLKECYGRQKSMDG
jgi:hypothetical protein